MGEGAGLAGLTFEKALMGCLRQRGVTLRSGFMRADGLDEGEMEGWGQSLESRLLAFETRYRGAQHLLGLTAKNKEPRWFRMELRRASAEICHFLLRHRSRLSALPRLQPLYESDLQDISGAIGEAEEAFITANLKREMDRMRPGFPEGAEAIAAWSRGSQALEMTFTRGRAQRRARLTFSGTQAGCLAERFEAAVGLWRSLEKAIGAEMQKAECWPSPGAQQSAEEARALALIDSWMRGLDARDRKTMSEHGSKALARWALVVRA